MLAALTDNKKINKKMDAGITTKKNIEWLKTTGYQYIDKRLNQLGASIKRI